MPATVARLSVTYLDRAGDVVWVDHHWVPEALRPQRTAEVAWSSTLPTLEVVDVPVATFDNGKVGGEEGVADTAGIAFPLSGDAIVVGGREITSVRLDVTSFQRAVEP